MIENEMQWNEIEELKKLQDEYKKINKIFSDFTKIKVNDADSIEKIEKLYKKLPKQSEFNKAIEELNNKTKIFIQKAKYNRNLNFNKLLNQFINKTKGANIPVRELSNSWRIGILELKTNSINSKIQFLYDREVVIDWKPIKTTDDIERYRLSALKLLNDSQIKEDELISIYSEAFNNIKIKYNQLVPIKDFFREIRIVCFKNKLINKKPDIKISKIDFPMWAFLYNTDNYLSISSKIPDGQRLIFQTGSQREISKGMGVFLKGLDPFKEYENFCYVTVNKVISK